MILYSVHENNKKPSCNIFILRPPPQQDPEEGPQPPVGWHSSRGGWRTPLSCTPLSTIHYPLSTWVALHYPVLFHSHSFNLAKGLNQGWLKVINTKVKVKVINTNATSLAAMPSPNPSSNTLPPLVGHSNMTHSQMLGKFEYTRGPIFKVVLEC